jgi:hypothetical protein
MSFPSINCRHQYHTGFLAVQVARHRRLLGCLPKGTTPLGRWHNALAAEYCAATLREDRFLHAAAVYSEVLGHEVPEGSFNPHTVAAFFGRGTVNEALWSQTLLKYVAFLAEHHRSPSSAAASEYGLARWIERQRANKTHGDLRSDRCAPYMCVYLQQLSSTKCSAVRKLDLDMKTPVTAYKVSSTKCSAVRKLDLEVKTPVTTHKTWSPCWFLSKSQSTLSFACCVW